MRGKMWGSVIFWGWIQFAPNGILVHVKFSKHPIFFSHTTNKSRYFRQFFDSGLRCRLFFWIKFVLNSHNKIASENDRKMHIKHSKVFQNRAAKRCRSVLACGMRTQRGLSQGPSIPSFWGVDSMIHKTCPTCNFGSKWLHLFLSILIKQFCWVVSGIISFWEYFPQKPMNAIRVCRVRLVTFL